MMPYAPATEPLESYCVIEGKRCTVEKMDKKKANLDHLAARWRAKGGGLDEAAIKVKAMREMGKHYKDIAAQLNITEDAVYRLMKRKL
jgi:DNA-binding CsgD family transcriptional regulator